MKDKLRELAGLMREAYRAGFIAACKWPAPVTQDVDSSAYNKEFNDWSFSVREKHAAILDTEGDGVFTDPLAMRAALQSVRPPAKPDAGVMPIAVHKWLNDRDLIPDTGEDGSFEVADLIEALNEHERQLLASRRAQPDGARQVPDVLSLDYYDAGALGDGGGGDVEWWQNYLRTELDRAHEFYQSQLDTAPPAPEKD